MVTRYHFVDCVINRHGICKGQNEEQEQECSCSCHTDPDFVHTCVCGSVVEWFTPEKGGRITVEPGTETPHMTRCSYWGRLYQVKPQNKSLKERIIGEAPKYH